MRCQNFSVAHKIAHYLGDVLEDQRDKLAENLLANGGTYFLSILMMLRCNATEVVCEKSD